MASRFNLLAAVLLLYVPTSCHAHGRMLSPCARSTLYICGLGGPANYNDHEMNCGGRVVQHDRSGGKCGICGDPYPGDHPYERPNGSMVQHNIIAETYLENQVIILRLQITVAHGGYHLYSICNVDKSGGVEATQECLDKIQLADENGNTQFTEGTTQAGYYDYHLVLPEGLTCSHCVIQWKWKCGNDWGCYPNGQCCTGCGDRQEYFFGCADVTIKPRDFRPKTTTQSTTELTSSSTTTSTTSSTARPTTTTTLASTPTTTPSPTTSALLSTLSSSIKSSTAVKTTASTTTTTSSTATPTTTSPTTTTASPPTTTASPTTTTASTTTTTASPTTTKLAPVIVPGNSFQQNRLNQIAGLRNRTNENSIEYYNRNSKTNNDIIKYATTEEFINMIMGNKTNISTRAGSNQDPSKPIWESEEKKMNDRICAMCATKNCYLNICRTSCPNVPPCTTSP